MIDRALTPQLQRTNTTLNERGRQLRYSELVRSDQPRCGNLADRWPLVFALPAVGMGGPQIGPPSPCRWGRFSPAAPSSKQKPRFMAKKKISSTDLIWIFHERLKAFDDHPHHGIPIAIVPVPSTGWTALTPRNVRLHRPLWENRVRAIEQELRNNYVLKG
jgi:hypothetical protein